MNRWLTSVCLTQNGPGNRLCAQEGHHGDHSHTALWAAQSVADKQRKGTAFVMETASELHFIGSLKDKAPVQDELSRRIFACVEDKKLYIFAVFGIDLLHIIHRRLCDAGTLGSPLNTLLKYIKPTMKKVYGGPDAAAQPSPLRHAAALLYAELPLLGHDYLSSIRVAWEALRAVQGALGGPIEGPAGVGGGTSAGDQEEQWVDSAEVLVGRVCKGLANEDQARTVGRAFAGALSAEFLGGE